MTVVSTGFFGAWFLGLVQGLTEFLPVSSSGHLVLFQQFFPIDGDDVFFDLILHVGTLLPVLWFYRRDVSMLASDPLVGRGPFLRREGVRLAGLLLLATIPTGIIGVVFKDVFELWFSTPAVLTLTFAVTGTLLFLSSRFKGAGFGLHQMAWWHAIVLGLAQGFAITPGISRSGTTIVVALALGLAPMAAARFSFLMSVPAILGAVVLKLDDADLTSMDLGALTLGGLTATASGYAALVLLVLVVKRRRLASFAWYCWAMAVVSGLLALWALLAPA
ncbi:MAG: undecaprenyl-diphosphate phosphatase [Deltaproteobacteria bacterium]|nr:MAG: undecaprenyl-diphosphate phosphatase [Deltaproteobacteria bacterium]